MKAALLLLLLASLGCTLPSQLHVAAVEETGLPPYTPESRVYLLGGEGAQHLKPGDVVALSRASDFRTSGRLRVFDLRHGQVLARLVEVGETHPMVGDVAIRNLPVPLPMLPPPAATPIWPEAEALSPRGPVGAPQAAHREALRFTPGASALSPAGQEKLAAWVEAWGQFGTWRVEVPQDAAADPAVLLARGEGLRERIRQLGVKSVELRTVPPVPRERFDVAFVVMEPW